MPIMSDLLRIERHAEALDLEVTERQGGPRNADWQASDADAIGVYPVPGAGTVVDG